MRARLKAALALGGAAIVGGATGMAVMHTWDVRRFTQAISLREEDRDAYVLQTMTRELHLHPEQREQVSQIQAVYRPRFEELAHREYPAMDHALDQINADIDAILTADQKKRFAEMVVIQKSRLRRRAGIR